MRNRLQNTIIMYHGVTTESSPYNSRHTLKKDFIKHLLYLKKYCNIISLDAYMKKEFTPDVINVAITFDDGYWNNFAIAKPILEELKIPATFFVTGINATDEDFLWADFVDIISKKGVNKLSINKDVFELVNEKYANEDQIDLHHYIKHIRADYESKKMLYRNVSTTKQYLNNTNEEFWRLMSDNEIIKTSKSRFISIQSHAFFHNNLGTIALKDAVNEIKLSKKYLENLTQKEVNTIGFPDGSYTRELLDESEKYGVYNFLAAEGYLFNTDTDDDRITDRKGIYNIGSYQNQLYNSLIKS